MIHPIQLRVAAAAALLVLAAACGGGGYGGSAPAPSSAPNAYRAELLMSDGAAPSAHTDPQLQDGWGIAIAPAALAIVANRGSASGTQYDGDGAAATPAPVTMPAGAAGAARPTGIVFNEDDAFHLAAADGTPARCRLLIASETGTLACWAPLVNAAAAIKVFEGAPLGARYTGLAAVNLVGASRLYAADFANRRIDAFDAGFARLALPPGAFVDDRLPAGYAPYNVAAIHGQLFVAYARPDAQMQAIAGAGQGLVNVFDREGHLLRRLVGEGSALDAPWGLALAPAEFGAFSNALLVANAGDGRIAAFDPVSGYALGTLARTDGAPIAIDGLHGIAFAVGLPDQNPADAASLFFAAGPGRGARGAYGRIDPMR